MSNKLRKMQKDLNKGTSRNEKEILDMNIEPVVYDLSNFKIKRINPDVMEMEIGYRPFTTFFEDFSIADIFGEDAILDTYKRCVKEWKDDVEYFTELVMTLSWKSAQHYEEGNDRYCEIYSDLYYKADEYAMENFKGKELSYYFRTTD